MDITLSLNNLESLIEAQSMDQSKATSAAAGKPPKPFTSNWKTEAFVWEQKDALMLASHLSLR